MRCALALLLMLPLALPAAAAAADRATDPERDILVTLPDTGAVHASGGSAAPYRKRKRYAMSFAAETLALELAATLELTEVARWPMRSLPVVCVVFRVPDGGDRAAILERLHADPRIDSAYALQRFDTRVATPTDYDDTYVALQRGLTLMDVPAAHRYTRGRGARIAVVDGAADLRHEDLEGRVTAGGNFTADRSAKNVEHGTAVTSVIGASANNALGIVGVAPEASIALYVACWTGDGSDRAICDSFTLAKALDSVATDGADVVNLSLSGPYDPLLERLLESIAAAGTVIVAAGADDELAGDGEERTFPASLRYAVGVVSSHDAVAVPAMLRNAATVERVHAPGRGIVVALPKNAYDFRSGSSLAAAHVSGVVALLRSRVPGLPAGSIVQLLRASERHSAAGIYAVNACAALAGVDATIRCP